MTNKSVALAATAALLVATLGACSEGGGSTTTEAVSASVSATSPVVTPSEDETTPEETSTDAAAEPVANPSPDAEQSAALIVALAAAGVVERTEDKAVRRARDMCSSVLQYDSTGVWHSVYSMEDLVRMRFTEDGLSDEQCQAVVDAIRAGGWCVEP